VIILHERVGEDRYDVQTPTVRRLDVDEASMLKHASPFCHERVDLPGTKVLDYFPAIQSVKDLILER
jgi:hypothetical protein